MVTHSEQQDRLQGLRTAYWAVCNLVNRRTLHFFLCDRQPELTTPAHAEIEIARHDAAGTAAQLAGLRNHDQGEYLARLAAGHWAVCVRGSDGAIQSWGWGTAPTGQAQSAPWENGIFAKVTPGTGFLWDFFTLPAYRGRGLYKTVLAHAAAECFRLGATRVWVYAESSNAASRGGLAGAGYRDDTVVEVLRLGPVCRITSPGFHQIVTTRGSVDLQRMLPPARGHRA